VTLSIFRTAAAGSAFIAALALNSVSVQSSSVFDVRIGKHPDKTRVVLDLDGRTAYRARLANGGRALVITLPNAQWDAGPSGLRHAKGLLSGYQQLRGPDGTLHLTLTGVRPMTVSRQFELAAKGRSSHRIVFDLQPVAQTAMAPAAFEPPVIQSTYPGQQTPARAVRRNTSGWLRASDAQRTRGVEVTSLDARVPATEVAQIPQIPQGPPPLQTRTQLPWSLTPRFEYLFINPNRRDGSSSSILQSETVPLLNFGGTLGYHTPQTDYLTTILYGFGDAKFTGSTSTGSTGTGRHETTLLDMEFLIRSPIQNSPLAITYGGRWINEETTSRFDLGTLTFAATGGSELKRSVNYYIGEFGFDASTPMGVSGRDRLFTEAKLGLGFWSSEIKDRTNQTVNPDEEDFLAAMELKLGYEFAGTERWSGQALYRASFLSLDDILEEFTIIHGPSVNFTYRF